MHVAVKNQKYSMIKIVQTDLCKGQIKSSYKVQTDLCKGQIKSSYKGQGGKDTHRIRPLKKQSPLLEMAGKLTWKCLQLGGTRLLTRHTLSVVCVDQSLSLGTHPSILTRGLSWGVMR